MYVRFRAWKAVVICCPFYNTSFTKCLGCDDDEELRDLPKSDFIIRAGSYDGSKLTTFKNLTHFFNGRIGPSSWLIQYDAKTRNPRFVYEYLRREDFQGEDNAKRKKNTFFPEPSLRDDFKIRPKDYNNWGFDRGHMVPAGDFPRSKESLQSTFTMANICPQVPSLNKGVWAKFEAWLRYLLMSEFDEMVVISGPLYAPVFVNGHWLFAHRTIGTFPKLITVPTHFFKVVIAIKKETISSGGKGTDKSSDVFCVGAFVLANSDYDYSQTPIRDLLVRIDQLQAISGLLFFEDYELNTLIKNKIDPFVPTGCDMRNLLAAGQLKELPSGTITIDTNGYSVKRPIIHPSSDDDQKDDGDIPQLFPQAVSPYSRVRHKPVWDISVADGRRSVHVKHLCSTVDCRYPFFSKHPP